MNGANSKAINKAINNVLKRLMQRRSAYVCEMVAGVLFTGKVKHTVSRVIGIEHPGVKEDDIVEILMNAYDNETIGLAGCGVLGLKVCQVDDEGERSVAVAIDSINNAIKLAECQLLERYGIKTTAQLFLVSCGL